MLSAERSSLLDSLPSIASRLDNGTYDSVLARADASRQHLGYEDIMMAMMDGNTAEYLLPQFLYQLHALETGVYECLVLVALDTFALSRCKSLHIPELCYLLDVSALQSLKRFDYYIQLGEQGAFLWSWCCHQRAMRDAPRMVGMQGGRRRS